MITKRYNLINNIGGWLVFVIALVTYWLTLEPTASYWDCGEFIIQADKLEVGHPPGNPIFMLTARFFANFAPDATYVPLMVNAMSGLLSALTILLLFWTISHLVRRLVVKDAQEGEISVQQYLAIMGSAFAGSLAFCWSDTFWFSAVEGEVYAFSSFCTALVFWLILKWENRAFSPHSDRYLILIAYVIGISVAVHLLNLLCIPAIVLVFCYRKFPNMDLVKSLVALVVSFVIIALVLFGLVPGIMKVAQQFELLCVNGMGMSFNSGALIYAVILIGLFVWSLYEINREKNATLIRLSFLLAVAFSGMLFFGEGFWLGIALLVALAAVLWIVFRKGLPVRVMNVIMWSMTMIFVGYSSYALILIRSTADTPMNQNSPDNVFDLASYLNREQYGKTPLLYGQTLNSGVQKIFVGNDERYADEGMDVPVYDSRYEDGKSLYGRGVPGVIPSMAQSQLNAAENSYNHVQAVRHKGSDYYVIKSHEQNPVYNPELNMLFPRIHTSGLTQYYENWYDRNDYNTVTLSAIDGDGNKVPEYKVDSMDDFEWSDHAQRYLPKNVRTAKKPSASQNLSYFINYQLNHMYMRYFMWNFAGRQNDVQNVSGELDAGNWISGIPFIDNARLGDQSLLPEEMGSGNKGHNVFFMLPLLLGIIGLLWQAFSGSRGIEQFWVVFFLFFMTGIAIVLYLNQTPMQPRERDYAFAGSFYAFAIWIGMGVAALWRILLWFFRRKPKGAAAVDYPVQVESVVDEPASWGRVSLGCAIAACVVGLLVPLQMVSQTWDDHDRSGRYAARDYAINYLESLEPNAIVFCNGDNDTFPLWYAQEVEGVRPDVRIVNLSYLASDWYANQMRMQSYDSAPVPMTATVENTAYDRLAIVALNPKSEPVDMLTALKRLYSGESSKDAGSIADIYPVMDSPFYIPVDYETVKKRGLLDTDSVNFVSRIVPDYSLFSKGYVNQSELLLLDIVATNAARGWERPLYICSTVGEEFHAGLTPYLRSTGMALQIVPDDSQTARTEKAYKTIMTKYRWGGADIKPGQKAPYFDETAGRMLTGVRSSILETAQQLMQEGDEQAPGSAEARDKYKKSLDLVNILREKLSERTMSYGYPICSRLAALEVDLGSVGRLNDKKVEDRGYATYKDLLIKMIPYLDYYNMIARTMGSADGNVPLSRNTMFSGLSYYQLYSDYESLGGPTKEIDAALKKAGYDIARLEEDYNSYLERLNRNESAYYDEEGTLPGGEESLQELFAPYMETVKRMQGLTAVEYATSTEEDRQLDSIFYYLVEGMQEHGEEVDLNGIDVERSKRLWKEYQAAHPDVLQ